MVVVDVRVGIDKKLEQNFVAVGFRWRSLTKTLTTLHSTALAMDAMGLPGAALAKAAAARVRYF